MKKKPKQRLLAVENKQVVISGVGVWGKGKIGEEHLGVHLP